MQNRPTTPELFPFQSAPGPNSSATHDGDEIAVWEELWRSIRACRRCQKQGFLSKIRPVFSPVTPSRWLLIGQAPGEVEQETGRPFSGRAGRQLFRWLAQTGWEEEAFRAQVYMTALTRCFPGKSRDGAGDRAPSTAERALCRPHLEAELALLRPSLLILVGKMAIETFLGTARLEEVVGKLIEQGGRLHLSLPHPSGASRWLNETAHKESLERALQCLREVNGELSNAGDR